MAGDQPIRRQREMVAKAYSIGRDPIPAASSEKEPDKRDNLFSRSQAIEPPYPLDTLGGLLEISNSLRQNVDSYAVNIEGFGHRFEPAINLEQDDARDQVIDSILAERLRAKRPTGTEDVPLKSLMPNDEEIDSRMDELRLLARVEKVQLEAFFAFAAQDSSFPKLRKLTRQDIEVLGNGFWEVLRNRAGVIARFVYVPAWTVRLRQQVPDPVEIEERIQISKVKFGTIKVSKRFRTFVQVVEDDAKPIYFREFGDPRIYSRETGKRYDDAEALKAAEPNSKPANELIHFQIESPLSPYGVPRWIGNLLSVLGSRSAEEVNYFYFENKAVPPLAILVSGGRLAKSSVGKIEDFIENHLKGRRNFHKILIIEATNPKGAGVEGGPQPQRPMISIEKLKDAQQEDALFQSYDQANMDKVGGSFRLPRLLRGESKDFNRATAEAALRMAEDQVFQPERDDFDFFINSRIMPELNARFWSFRSNSPVARNPEVMGKIAAAFVKEGVLTPEEGRLLAGDIFNRDFAVIKEAWVKQPMQFTLAGIQTGQQAPVGAEKGTMTSGDLAAGGLLRPAQGATPKIPSIESSPEELARALLRIRSAIANAEVDLEKESLGAERSVEVIEVDSATMRELVDVDGGNQ